MASASHNVTEVTPLHSLIIDDDVMLESDEAQSEPQATSGVADRTAHSLCHSSRSVSRRVDGSAWMPSSTFAVVSRYALVCAHAWRGGEWRGAGANDMARPPWGGGQECVNIKEVCQ